MKNLKRAHYEFIGKVSFIIIQSDDEVIHQSLHIPVPRIQDDIVVMVPGEKQPSEEEEKVSWNKNLSRKVPLDDKGDVTHEKSESVAT